MKQITIDITSETPEFTFNDVGIPGPQGKTGDTGAAGKDFKYEDFTVSQLAALRGEKGDTGEKGDDGKQGLKGDTGNTGAKGDTGAAFTYADMTDSNKDDLRQPLRTEFAQTLADTKTALSDAQTAATGAQAAQTASEAARDTTNSILTEAKVVQTDVDSHRQGIDDAVARADALAASVENDVKTITIQADNVTANTAAVAFDKDEAKAARDEAVAAKVAIVADKDATLDALNDAQQALTSTEQARDVAVAAKNDVTTMKADITAQQTDITAKHTDVTNLAAQVTSDKATVASDKATVASDKDTAVAAKNDAVVAKDKAEAAAVLAQAALVYEGTWDASTGAYPTHKARNGIWKVVKGGTVNGTVFKTGQELVWNNDTNNWDIIPADTVITSVNGQAVGDIVLTAADVGALPDTTALFSGKYSDLTGVPTEFTPKAHSQAWGTITGKPAQATRWPTFAEVTNKPTLFSGAYADLTGKPALFSGNYADLKGTPTEFTPTAHTHAWASITGKPTYATRWPTPAEIKARPDTWVPSAHDVGAYTQAETDARARMDYAVSSGKLRDMRKSGFYRVNPGVTDGPNFNIGYGQMMVSHGESSDTTMQIISDYNNDKIAWRCFNNNGADTDAHNAQWKTIYHKGDKPTWGDVGGNTYFTKDDNTKYIYTAANYWSMAANSERGWMPSASGTGTDAKSFLGNSGWWFKEMWANAIRGGYVNVTGNVIGKRIIANKFSSTSTSWENSGNADFMRLGVYNAAKGGDLLEIRPAGAGVSNRTAGFDVWSNHNVSNTNLYEGANRVYSDANKPTPASLGAVSRTRTSITDGTDLFEYFKTAPTGFYSSGSAVKNKPAADFSHGDYMVIQHGAGYSVILAISSIGKSYTLATNPTGNSGWVANYSTLNKPTPADIGAESSADAWRFRGKAIGSSTITDLEQLWDLGRYTSRSSGYKYANLPSGCNPAFVMDVTSIGNNYRTLTITDLHGNTWVKNQVSYAEPWQWSEWRHVYDTSHKPTAVDVGALPATGKAKDSEKLLGLLPASSPTPATVVTRDTAADIQARLFRSTYATQSEIKSSPEAGICFRVSTSDNFMRFVNKSGMVNWLGRVNDSTRFLGKTLDQVKAETRSGLVTDTRTVNGKRLNANISISASDVGLGNVANYGHSNSYNGTSTALYATQKAAYDAAAAPRLEASRKTKITSGTAAPTGGADGDVYLQYK